MTTGYISTIATTLLLWDILVTFPREKSYIWSYHPRTNWITLFYIITRYLPFIVSAACLRLQLEGSVTTNLNILYTIPWFIVLGCTELLFIIRTVALHCSSVLLAHILGGLFICEIIATLLPSSLRAFWSLGPDLEVDIPSPVVSSSFALPELVFQGLLVLLVMQKAISDWRSVKKGSKSFTMIIVRDGLWGYCVNLFGLLVIFIRPTWLPGPLGQANLLFSYISFSVTGTRLILNLRAVAAKRSGANDTPTVDSSSTFLQGVQSFFAPENDELSTPHYFDFESDAGSDD